MESKDTLQSIPSQAAFLALQKEQEGDYPDGQAMPTEEEKELARVLEQIRLLEGASPPLVAFTHSDLDKFMFDGSLCNLKTPSAQADFLARIASPVYNNVSCQAHAEPGPGGEC